MATVRRWYMFLSCAISLQFGTWAVIALLRNLFTLGQQVPVTAIAFQIAVIVVALPIFLVHWLWAQRLARQDADERETAVRRLYLYGMLAAYLGPFVFNALNLVTTLLRLAFGEPRGDFFSGFSPTEAIIRNLVAMVVLGVLWFYHQRIVAEDAEVSPETGDAATVRRLYILGFSAVGGTMTILGIIRLLRWITFQFGGGAVISGLGSGGLAAEVARLSVGMPLWLLFWVRAQHLFTGPSEEACTEPRRRASRSERESALRKLYLYLTLFIAVLGAVTNATFILAGSFRRLLDLPARGDIRGPLPVVIGMVVPWAYHTYVLRRDAALAGEVSRQAGIRRLYLYLIAGIGLAAFLVGLSGDISVLIRSLAERALRLGSVQVFGADLKEQLAWFTAALMAGLPVWILPWRQAQIEAVAPGPAGAEERRSVVRKIYLYFYLFVATMTVLSSVVYIVFRLLSLVLGEGETGNLLSDLGQPIAFSLIAVGVWLYHGFALRSDRQLTQREQVEHLMALRIAVVDVGEGLFGRAVLDELQRELPGLTLDPIGLTQSAAEAMGTDADHDAIAARLAGAELIAGPWVIAVAGGAGGAVTAEIAEAVAASPARKLLVPVWAEGWEWAGVDRWNAEAIVRQTVGAVKQMVEGEEVKPARPPGAGAIIAIIIGVLFLLILLAIPVLTLFSQIR
ncbi:MAG: DUF5671 domain-containing protein [Anaerolineae bacterium]